MVLQDTVESPGEISVTTAKLRAEGALLVAHAAARRLVRLVEAGASEEQRQAALDALVAKVRAADALAREVPGCDWRPLLLALVGGAR